MVMKFTNNATTTLASNITSIATSLTVAGGGGALFPTLTASDYFYCTLANSSGTIEIIKVTARSTDTFTITRAQDNTVASAFTAGDKVELRLVAASLNDLPKLDEANTFSAANTFSTTLGVTGVATFSAGTAALPAITTTGDTNTGIFFPAADTIAFAEGGAEVARFDSSGNFGLGVTPTYRLDVTRSGNGVSARFSQGSFFAYIYSGSAASYFSADTGALTSYGLAASTLSMSAGNGGDQLVVSQTSVKPNVLLDISGASAGQIKFPATQNASSNANTLDDYEEGTWTPSLGGTATYDIRTGTYTKIGNVVTVTGSIRPSSLGTGSTNTLTGLPFSVAAEAAGGIAYGDGFAVSVYSVYLYVTGTSLITYGYTAAAANTPVVNLFQTNARIYFTATYLTS